MVFEGVPLANQRIGRPQKVKGPFDASSGHTVPADSSNDNRQHTLCAIGVGPFLQPPLLAPSLSEAAQVWKR